MNASPNLSKETLHKFLRLFRYLRQYNRQVGDYGIKPWELSVMLYLQEAGSATVGQIQAFLYRSPSTTSTMIAKLETNGYLTRERSTQDNRVVIVTLTEKGQDVAQNAPLGGIPLLRRRLNTLPEDRLQRINDVLTELTLLMDIEEIE